MGFYDRILGKKKPISGSSAKEEVLPGRSAAPDVPDKNGIDKADALTWVNKGDALVGSSMYAEAIQCYDKALELNQRFQEVWNNKGLALARTGRYAEAIKCYDKALELKPDDEEVIYNKGIALAQLGQFPDAIANYDKLLEINPKDASSWCGKGDVLFESGNFEEALRAYDKAIEINPKDETVWNNRGLTLVKLNRFSEAIESYDKAIEINPAVEKIWSNKGLALVRMKQAEEKIDLQKTASSMPGGEKTESFTEDKPDEQPAILKPEVSEMKTDLIRVESEFKETEQVELPVIESVKEAKPETSVEKPDLKGGEISKESLEHLVTGNTLYSMGKYEEAIDSFDKSLQTDPGNATVWNNKGLALTRSGKFDDAVICYDKAIQIDPNDYVFFNNKGNTLYKKGTIKEAMESYESAFKLNPESRTAKKGIEMCLKSLKKSGKQRRNIR